MTAGNPEKAVPEFRFATKAKTLERLAGRLTAGKLCDQVIVDTLAWSEDREAIVEQITGRFDESQLVVRSSATAEDGWDNSLAGAHLSVIDVNPSGRAITAAIVDVFASYSEPSADDEVLVQAMVNAVAISGVVLTRDLDTGSPYYTINYDDFSGRTDTVTGGDESKTLLVHRARTDALKSPRLRKLIDCVIELEAITGTQELDVEFCITETEDVYILQVRPLAARRQWTPPRDDAIDAAIDRIRDDISRRMRPEPGLAGRTTILAEMTDWNPAEMIGTTPRPLALSLYKSLITERVWAEARARMGYRRVDGPLLVDFHGRPFIDVRRSLNSFLPAGIGEGVAGRLIDHQLARLAENRDLHDKVEFEIAVTCRDFTFETASRRLAEAGLEAHEIENLENALGAFTGAILENGAGDVSRLVEQANRLLETRPGIDTLAPIERSHRLLDDCRNLGTLPFSQLARHGFIGIQFLKSLVARDVFAQEDMNDFMHGIQTVATELARDMRAIAAGTKPETEFFARYGHLRPGTYDIVSWRYDERPNLFLGHAGPEPYPSGAPFELSASKRTALEKLLDQHGYRLSADGLLAYIAASVKAREQAKFAFSRAISDALSALVQWGEEVGFSRDDLSFLPIEAFQNPGDTGALEDAIAEARENFLLTRAIRLPHVIVESTDIDIVRLPMGRPNFITGKSVTAPATHLTPDDVPDIDGRIVLIESADPGFDWIFSRGISGLVTKFGGVNSHMSIRCAEFSLPAAIGCGERLFETLSKAAVIELNCAARKVSGH